MTGGKDERRREKRRRQSKTVQPADAGAAVLTRGKGERERASSAAKQIRRTNGARAVRYRARECRRDAGRSARDARRPGNSPLHGGLDQILPRFWPKRRWGLKALCNTWNHRNRAPSSHRWEPSAVRSNVRGRKQPPGSRARTPRSRNGSRPAATRTLRRRRSSHSQAARSAGASRDT